MKLIIPSPILSRIIDLCRQSVPREAVGLLAAGPGDVGVVGAVPQLKAVAPCHNRSPTPEVAFFVDPHEQYRIEQACELAGLRIIGSYHSHPTRDAEPSGTDCEFMGDRIMMIIGLGSESINAHNRGETPAFRAWRSVDGHTEEVELQVVHIDQFVEAAQS